MIFLRWKNTLRIANTSIALYPRLAGAKKDRWFIVLCKWRRTDLKLWQKYSVQKPTINELIFAAILCEKLTGANQEQYEIQHRLFLNNRMREYAYRALK